MVCVPYDRHCSTSQRLLSVCIVVDNRDAHSHSCSIQNWTETDLDWLLSDLEATVEWVLLAACWLTQGCMTNPRLPDWRTGVEALLLLQRCRFDCNFVLLAQLPSNGMQVHDASPVVHNLLRAVSSDSHGQHESRVNLHQSHVLFLVYGLDLEVSDSAHLSQKWRQSTMIAC